MPLPGVQIIIVNGGLGRSIQTQDGLSGLVVTNTGSHSGLALLTPTLFTSRREIKELYDGGTLSEWCYKEIDDFFLEAGDGSQLYVMTVANTAVLEDLCDHTEENSIAKLLDFAEGKIRLLGVSLKPGSAPDLEHGIAEGAFAAGAKAELAAAAYTALMRPFRVILPASHFNDVATDLRNRTAEVLPHVGFVIGGKDNTKIPAIGLALGTLASIPVQRKPSRVKTGPVSVSASYIGTKKVGEITTLDVIHDRGYMFLRTYEGRAGFYWNGDPTFVSPSSDFSSISNGRVIDKAITLVYDSYVDEIDDEVQVDVDGKLPISVVKYLEGKIENRVKEAMAGEISNFNAIIDPNQNVITSSKLVVTARITPVGYLTAIEVQLGFENPFLTA